LAPYNLFILANVIEIKHYSFGQIISPQGKKPDFFGIILSGICKAVYEGVIIQNSMKETEKECTTM
jgi:hypothetical protein